VFEGCRQLGPGAVNGGAEYEGPAFAKATAGKLARQGRTKYPAHRHDGPDGAPGASGGGAFPIRPLHTTAQSEQELRPTRLSGWKARPTGKSQ